jgi:hypothetical protein
MTLAYEHTVGLPIVRFMERGRIRAVGELKIVSLVLFQGLVYLSFGTTRLAEWTTHTGLPSIFVQCLSINDMERFL